MPDIQQQGGPIVLSGDLSPEQKQAAADINEKAKAVFTKHGLAAQSALKANISVGCQMGEIENQTPISAENAETL